MAMPSASEFSPQTMYSGVMVIWFSAISSGDKSHVLSAEILIVIKISYKFDKFGKNVFSITAKVNLCKS